MEMNILPIEELRDLLSAVSHHGERHLVEVESDLQQTAFLLNEAIEKLSASFMHVHGLLMEQQQVIEAAQSSQNFDTDTVRQLNDYKEKIGIEVNAVVTGLQFQDMTNQLIHRTIKRVNGLNELLQELAEHGYATDPNKEHQDIAKFLESVNQNLDASSHALSGNLRKSVGQQNMSTGDVDLF